MTASPQTRFLYNTEYSLSRLTFWLTLFELSYHDRFNLLSVMDPLSLSAGVAGFLGLAIEVTKILNAYIKDVNDAPKETSELKTKVSILSHVLEKLVDILQSDDVEAITFGEQSLLFSVVSSCERHVKLVYKNLAKLRDANKVKALIGRVS
ncbi:hypothetical protein FPQ18DRAFT_68253 [Pyronema domesticum]|nr:hypothetical protein FPQ18DRAFT_68253 [Pyronema domesticum]